MECIWTYMVLSILYTTLNAAPLQQNEWNPDGCSFDQWHKCAGTCNETECRINKQLCTRLNQEWAHQIKNDTVNNSTSVDENSCVADYLFDPNQVEILLDRLPDPNRRAKRMIRRDFPVNKWTSPICYVIHKAIDDIGHRAIRAGIKLWSSSTCVIFTEYDSEKEECKRQRIIFVKSFGGCSSFIGRSSILHEQPIYVSSRCHSPAVIAHEIAHALGIIHEHQRPDRDSFITIKAKDIIKGYEGFFAIFKPNLVTDLEVEYDYASVMHYHGAAFSNTSSNTIVTKDPKYQRTIGQRVELSFLDVKLINRAYCQNECTNMLPKPCHNHGYQDPHNCNICRCPDGWYGQYCDRIAPAKSASCGGELTATSNKKYLTSPGYEHGSYKIGQECTWLIKANGNNRIQLEFEGNFALFDEGTTCYHWVEIRSDVGQSERNTQDLNVKGPRFCGVNRPTDKIISIGNSVLVLFRAKFEWSSRKEMVGFKIAYTADGEACSSHPCLNSGHCEESGNNFTCRCIGNYHGDLCENYGFHIDMDINLVMMLDSTFHSYKDFYYYKEFSKRIFAYTLSEEHEVNRGLLTFDQYARSHVHLGDNDYYSLRGLNNIIVSLYTNYGWTNIFSAFNILFSLFYKNVATVSNNIVPNVALMTTDSYQSILFSQGMTQNVTRKLRDRCVEIVVIVIKVSGEIIGRIIDSDNIIHKTDQVVLLDTEFIDTVLTLLKSAVQRSYNCMRAVKTTTTSTTSTTAKPTTTTTTVKPTTTTTTTTTIKSTTPTTKRTTPTTKRTTRTTKRTTPTTKRTTPTTKRTTPTTTTTIKPTTKSPTTTSTTVTTSTTSATTTTTTTKATTTKNSQGMCQRTVGKCDQPCGGCGYRDVVQICTASNGQSDVEKYREQCNLKPCQGKCPVWIGKLYIIPCLNCCGGFIKKGDVCLQTEPDDDPSKK